MSAYVADRQAKAILDARRLVHEAHATAQAANDALYALEKCLHTIRSTDDAPELEKLLDRIQTQHRLFNSMELGSFTIRVSHAMDAAWGKLP